MAPIADRAEASGHRIGHLSADKLSIAGCLEDEEISALNYCKYVIKRHRKGKSLEGVQLSSLFATVF